MSDSTPADEVRRTLHAYCRLLDARDLDALVSQVYLPDAVDDRHRGEPLRGREQIRDYFERALTTLEATAHLLTNVDVTIMGTRAHATSRVTAYHWSAEPARPAPRPAEFVLLGSYEDELALTPAGWRIASRDVRALGAGGLASGALPGVFAGFGGRR